MTGDAALAMGSLVNLSTRTTGTSIPATVRTFAVDQDSSGVISADESRSLFFAIHATPDPVPILTFQMGLLGESELQSLDQPPPLNFIEDVFSYDAPPRYGPARPTHFDDHPFIVTAAHTLDPPDRIVLSLTRPDGTGFVDQQEVVKIATGSISYTQAVMMDDQNQVLVAWTQETDGFQQILGQVFVCEP
jgi:hypothetical protein